MKSIDIRNMLSGLGYNKNHFSENYHVQINGTSALRFDYVAFSDEYIQDVSTSCIAIQEVRNTEEEQFFVRNTKYMATPVLILAREEKVQIWNITSDQQVLVKEDEEKVIQIYFEKNRFEFMSDSLIGLKQGLRQINLFEAVGLIDFSRNATCKILSEEFTKGLVAAKTYIKHYKNINNHDLNNITSITMHIISALIINSKVNLEQNIPDIFELLSGLSEKYEEYFSDKLMMKYGEGLISDIYKSLNSSINYQSVDHELLGYFYESTLLQLNKVRANNIRKEFGIYYTPRVLSTEIVNSIPIENIPVDKRRVLDGTCGSGSLLLSACKRLENLVYYEYDGFERHDYLTKMIFGYDLDRFASEVARLSLLLYSLPYGNKWNVKSGDLLKIKKFKEDAPFIILGNPPYEEKRADKIKSQKATEFLDKYISWLHEDGYIGIILPESFLQNDSSTIQREQLIKNFDILELWSLPGSVFENNCATIVVIAQKKKLLDFKNIVKIKILTRNSGSIKNYFGNQKWDFVYFDTKQQEWENAPRYKISFSPIDIIIKKLKKYEQNLDDVTNNIMGIMLPSYYNGFSKLPFDGWVPYITNALNFQKYYISDKMESQITFFNYNMSFEEEENLKESYKGLRLRRKHKDIYAMKSKVLIKMSSTPGEISCISAFVDEDGYYPSHSFFVVVSKDENITNEAICATVNSKLINAYIRKECVKRTLTTGVVRSIPIPKFSKEEIKQISYIFRNIKHSFNNKNTEIIKKLEKELDYIVYKAFRLTEAEIKLVESYYNVYTGEADILNQEEVVDVIENENHLNISGEVIDVDIRSNTCKILSMETDEITVEITHNMPGWFLRKGAKFSGKLYNDMHLSDIKPLAYSYLGDDDIVSYFKEKLWG